MAVAVTQSFLARTDKSKVFERLGGFNQVNNNMVVNNTTIVCKYWLDGRCTRNPCRFSHSIPEENCQFRKSIFTWKGTDCGSKKNTLPESKIAEEPQQKLWKRKNTLPESKTTEETHRTLLKRKSTLPQSRTAEETQQKLLKREVMGSANKNSPCGGKIAQETQQRLLKTEVSGSKNKSIQKAQEKLPKIEAAANGEKIIQKSQQQLLKAEIAGRGNKSIQNAQQELLKAEVAESGYKNIQKHQQKVCKSWAAGNCVNADKCEDLHSWSSGNGFSMLARLKGHTKAVTGVALPTGSDKLFSGSTDNSVRFWDCNSGQCAGVVNYDTECGTLVSEGPWVFIGLLNAVKVANVETQHELILQGPIGQVHAIALSNDTLFAGAEDGTILAWRFTSATTSPQLVASLKGHSGAVLSLVVGANNRLYSGSADHTIRVWDFESLQCVQTLDGHTDDVTSVLCWDSFLLSGSLDNKIKVWGASESGNIEVVYEFHVDDGVLAFCGIHDAEDKPVLLCSCKDNTVRLYDLPTFIERGRIFATQEVKVIRIGTGGLFFTGDAAGEIFVWKLHGKPSSDPSITKSVCDSSCS